MHAEHSFGLLVGGTLPHLAPKFDAPGLGRCQARLDEVDGASQGIKVP